MNFSGHIPPPLFDNVNVRGFLDVLDGVGAYKENLLYRSVNMLVNPLLQDNPDFLRKFLKDAGSVDNLYGINRQALENLILNAYDIYSYKGSPRGVCLYFRSLLDFIAVTNANTILTYVGDEIHCDGEDLNIILNFSGYWGGGVWLIPGNYEGLGVLPNGESLGIAASTPSIYPYLFGGQDFDFYYRQITIKLYSDVLLNYAYRSFIDEVVYKYLSMTTEESSVVTINYYKYDGTPITGNDPIT